jgi:lipopolysaccharide export system protein LptA
MSMVISLLDLFHPHPAVGRRGLLGLAAAAAICVLTGASGGRMPSCTVSAGPGKEPVTCSASKVDLDYKTNVMHMSGDVKISQADISVAADAAQATIVKDSKNSHWVFTGNVHVRAEREGDLRADRATVEIINSALASAHATGSPARFEQTHAKNGDLAKGHSNTADYDVVAGTVTLTGDAVLTLSDGQNVLKGPSITYNVREQKIQVTSDAKTAGRSHLTMAPKSGHDANAGTGKP